MVLGRGAGFVRAAILVVVVVMAAKLAYDQVVGAGWRARAVFGTTPEEAEATKALAFNQGFYNLFLAVVTLAGMVLWAAVPAVSTALLTAGCGSMLAAAVVLGVSSPDKMRAAVVQGVMPLVALVALLAA
ncbi:DUF1304 domain-containing protein [Corynebacterium bovis]